jgi:hypothetical protein
MSQLFASAGFQLASSTTSTAQQVVSRRMNKRFL